MGDVIKVDFRNKCVRIKTEDREVSTEILFDNDDTGNHLIMVNDVNGNLLTMRSDDGIMYVTKGSPLWIGLALRATFRIWPGGDDVFGAFSPRGYGDVLAAESVGFVERNGLFYRDSEEEWPEGMVEEALMTENAMKEEGLKV